MPMVLSQSTANASVRLSRDRACGPAFIYLEYRTVDGKPVRAAFAGLNPYNGGFQEPNHPGYQPIYITPKYSPPAKANLG